MEKQLQEIGLINYSSLTSSRLMKFVGEIDVHFVRQNRSQLLQQARKLILNDFNRLTRINSAATSNAKLSAAASNGSDDDDSSRVYSAGSFPSMQVYHISL